MIASLVLYLGVCLWLAGGVALLRPVRVLRRVARPRAAALAGVGLVVAVGAGRRARERPHPAPSLL